MPTMALRAPAGWAVLLAVLLAPGLVATVHGRGAFVAAALCSDTGQPG